MGIGTDNFMDSGREFSTSFDSFSVSDVPELRRSHRVRASRAMSVHASLRSAQRNVKVSEVDYILQHARCCPRTGVWFYFLGERDIPFQDRANSNVTRLQGAVVMVAANGEVITIYRNRRAWKMINRKMKFRLAPMQVEWGSVDTYESLAS